MNKQPSKVHHSNCLQCGEPIESVYSIKKYCSKPCNDKHWAANNPERRKVIWRKYNESHKKENNARMKAIRKRNPLPPMNAEERKKNTSRGIARYLLAKHRPHVCVDCGLQKSRHREIVCHHMDGDVFNNSLDNLQWLCHPCHGLKHRKD